jgi:hypothetical protein
MTSDPQTSGPYLPRESVTYLGQFAELGDQFPGWHGNRDADGVAARGGHMIAKMWYRIRRFLAKLIGLGDD